MQVANSYFQCTRSSQAFGRAFTLFPSGSRLHLTSKNKLLSLAMDAAETNLRSEYSLPRRSLQSFISGEDGEVKQGGRPRRRSVRGRRSIAPISSDHAPTSADDQVSLSDVPTCEDRVMQKIKQLKEEMQETAEYGKDLDLQLKKWELLKTDKEAAVLEAERSVSSPVTVSSRKAAFILDKYVGNAIQGCSAFEISQILLKRVTDHMKLQQMNGKDEEIMKLEKELHELEETIELQLKFLNIFHELDFETKIAEFDAIVEEEREWFSKNNLQSEFASICAGN